MKVQSIGKFPNNYGQMEILESIGESIVLTDAEYNVRWVNPTGVLFMQKIATTYGILNIREMIGMNMGEFHQNPKHRQQVMDNLEQTHRSMIYAKGNYSAEVIVNPIKNEANEKVGYAILIVDVTDKIKKQEEQKKLIQDLSVPILKIWKDILAVPLKGSLDEERFDILTEQLMNTCAKYGSRYVLLDLSGIQNEDNHMVARLDHLQSALKLVGAKPIIVGISPKLAMSLSKYGVSWLTYNNVEQGIQYIIEKEGGMKNLF